MLFVRFGPWTVQLVADKITTDEKTWYPSSNILEENESSKENLKIYFYVYFLFEVIQWNCFRQHSALKSSNVMQSTKAIIL